MVQRYSVVSFLEKNLILVRRSALLFMHHLKFAVIDMNSVEQGPFNWPVAADRQNAEDALLIFSVPDLAALYAAEWQRLWDESQWGRADGDLSFARKDPFAPRRPFCRRGRGLGIRPTTTRPPLRPHPRLVQKQLDHILLLSAT